MKHQNVFRLCKLATTPCIRITPSHRVFCQRDSDAARHHHRNHDCPQYAFSCQQRHVTAGSFLERKHRWSFNELLQNNEQIILFLQSINEGKQLTNASSKKTPPITADHVFNVLEAWMELSKDGIGIRAAREALSLLNVLESKRYESPLNTVFHPPTSFYDVVLQAFTVCGGLSDSANACESILLRMIHSCIEDSARSKPFILYPQPTTKTFNIVINAWAKSGNINSGQRAEDVARMMETWNAKVNVLKQRGLMQYSKCHPNARTLSSVVDAWARSGHPVAPDRALEILLDCVGCTPNRHSNNPWNMFRDVEIDIAVFNSVLYTWVRSKRGREAAIKCEEILHWLINFNSNGSLSPIQPNARTVGVIIDAWTSCEKAEGKGDAAGRAERMLLNMIDLYRKGFGIKPDATLFAMCIRGWSWCADVDNAPEKAEHMFNLLTQLYEETNDDCFKPNGEVGDAVLSVWARAHKRKDSGMRLFMFLKNMELSAQATILSFNIALDSMGKKGQGEDALRILNWLEENSRSGSITLRPDSYSYNNTIAALARSNTNESALQAESLLQSMKEMISSDLNLVKPCKVSYTLVIDAWSRSPLAQKVARAWLLVKEMMSLFESGNTEMKPDVYVFTALMKCCAKFKGNFDEKKDVLQVSLMAMNKLETVEFGPPNHIAYSTFMDSVTNLCTNEHERSQYLNSTYKKCVETGNVSKNVLKSFVRGTGIQPQPGQLRPEWSKNVPKRELPLDIYFSYDSKQT